MELGSQIKKYRNELSLSQDELAEKIYVSRQTISNWENDKSYPDVNSLVLLSEVFNTSIDNLIKGDVEVMKQEVGSEERKAFEKLGQVYTVLLLMVMITPIPLIYFFDWSGMIIWGILFIVALCVAFVIEKKKKQFDIQTYKEIISFTEGKGLDEIAKAREEGKRPYQKIALVFVSSLITFIVAMLFVMILV